MLNAKHSLSLLAATAVVMAINLPQAVKAQEHGAAAQSDAQSRIVPDMELQKLRGGLRIGGLDISLGADIRTYLDGELVLHTTVNWGEDGAEIVQVASDSLTPADAANLQGSILNQSFALTNREGQQVFLANDGQTALFHRTDGALQNFLINGAQGANVSQTVNANIGIEGYQDFAAGLARTQLSNNISDDMASVTNGAIGF